MRCCAVLSLVLFYAVLCCAILLLSLMPVLLRRYTVLCFIILYGMPVLGCCATLRSLFLAPVAGLVCFVLFSAGPVISHHKPQVPHSQDAPPPHRRRRPGHALRHCGRRRFLALLSSNVVSCQLPVAS